MTVRSLSFRRRPRSLTSHAWAQLPLRVRSEARAPAGHGQAPAAGANWEERSQGGDARSSAPRHRPRPSATPPRRARPARGPRSRGPRPLPAGAGLSGRGGAGPEAAAAARGPGPAMTANLSRNGPALQDAYGRVVTEKSPTDWCAPRGLGPGRAGPGEPGAPRRAAAGRPGLTCDPHLLRTRRGRPSPCSAALSPGARHPAAWGLHVGLRARPRSVASPGSAFLPGTSGALRKRKPRPASRKRRVPGWTSAQPGSPAGLGSPAPGPQTGRSGVGVPPFLGM